MKQRGTCLFIELYPQPTIFPENPLPEKWFHVINYQHTQVIKFPEFMDRYKLLLPLLLGFVVTSLQAQTRVITGQVTDEYEEPLVGVTVTTTDHTSGTITGLGGYYRLEVPESVSSLLFSYIGYEKKEVSTGRSNILQVILSESDNILNEVIVVGYGVQRKKDVTGSIVSIKPDKMENMPSVNIAQMLQGKLPGLNITNEASSASGAVNIRIRAQNSITAGTTPLIILDGIEYSEGMAQINPLDIESVDVLKDASSSAIYGAKAANGVILITTKRGTTGKTSVAFSATMGIQKATNLPDMMNSETFYRFKEERLGYVSAFDTRQYEKGVDTNWLKQTLCTGHTQDYSISFSGGNQQTRYYISGNLARIEGTPQNDDFNRYNLRLNFDTKLASWLTFETTTYFMRTDSPGQRADIATAIRMSPLTQPYDENGELSLWPNEDDSSTINPLESLNTEYDYGVKSIYSNNSLKVDLPFIPGLSYKILYGYNYYVIDSELYKSSKNTVQGMAQKGYAQVIHQNSQKWTLENIVSYNRNFGKHGIFVTGLYSANESIFKYRSMTGSGFPDDIRGVYQFENASVLNAYDTFTKRTGISQMIRANYTYNSRYLLTLTMRRDGDSVFGKGNKYGTFPSVALGWNMEQEEFFRGWEFLDQSKLRISYGKNGNQDILPYSTLATVKEQYYLDGDGNSLSGFYANKLADTSLTWEKTRQLNAGWDFSFLKGRISGSLDLFYASTHDLLLDKTIPHINGVSSIRQNVGRTKSNGIEIGLSTENIRTRNVEWRTDLTLSHSKNRIVHVGLYDENGKPADNVANQWFIGKLINAVYGYKFDGIWQEGDDIANSHMPDAKPGDVKVLDYDGDGRITTADRHVFASGDPRVTAGLMNTVRYKGITFSLFMYGSAGATRYTEYNSPYFEKWNIRDRKWWTPEDPINTYPANRSDTNPYSVSIFGKGNNASFIRVADISLAYSFPRNILNPVGIKRLEVFGNIKNPFLFTSYVGLDPEYKADYSAPAYRSFLFGIKLGI